MNKVEDFKPGMTVRIANNAHTPAHYLPVGSLAKVVSSPSKSSPYSGPARRVEGAGYVGGPPMRQWVHPDSLEIVDTETESLRVGALGELQVGDVVTEATSALGYEVRVDRKVTVPPKPGLPVANGTIIRRKAGYGNARAVLVGDQWRMVNSGNLAHPDDWQDGWEFA